LNPRAWLGVLMVGGILAAQALPALAQDLTDPTRAPAPPAAIRKSVAAPANLPRVSAIFHGAERSIAIFDGRPVQAGDQVGVYHIEAVMADGVRYRIGAKVATALLPTPGSPPLAKDK
jgi:hypothetical protein